MEIKTVTTAEELEELRAGSAFTREGLEEKAIPDLIKWIKQYTPMIRERI